MNFRFCLAQQQKYYMTKVRGMLPIRGALTKAFVSLCSCTLFYSWLTPLTHFTAGLLASSVSDAMQIFEMISRQFPNPIICFFLLTLNNSVQKHKASLKCEPDAAGCTNAHDTCGKHQGRFVYAYKVYPKCDLLGYLYSFYVKIQSLIPFTLRKPPRLLSGGTSV